MRHKRKEEPWLGQKTEKRKKRRWDRKPEITEDYKYGTFEIYWTVPHITLREKKKK